MIQTQKINPYRELFIQRKNHDNSNSSLEKFFLQFALVYNLMGNIFNDLVEQSVNSPDNLDSNLPNVTNTTIGGIDQSVNMIKDSRSSSKQINLTNKQQNQISELKQNSKIYENLGNTNSQEGLLNLLNNQDDYDGVIIPTESDVEIIQE